DDVASLHEAVRYFQSLNKTMNDMTLHDFPLSEALALKIKVWKDQLGPNGRGFQLVKGVPVGEWSMEQCEMFFWAFGKYLGKPGAQDMEGSLLGHVTDVGNTNKVERPYRKSVDIAYHCDGADIVGLLCIHPAKTGGESRIISSVAVYNALLTHTQGQSYVRRLFGKVLLFTRKSFGLSSNMPVHPFRMDSTGVLRTFWNQEYYAKSYKDSDGILTPPGVADPFVLEAIEAYDSILANDMQQRQRRLQTLRTDGVQLSQGEGQVELGLDMNLQQGDIQLVSNHFVMHARTEFVDYTEDDLRQFAASSLGGEDEARLIPPYGKRDLLRLWVSESTDKMPWGLYVSKQIDFIGVIGGLIEGVIKYR
ncbi:SAT17, partial [Symbiodinium microadriaticum]